MTRAATPMAIPTMEIVVIIVIKFSDFFENKYRQAINRAVFMRGYDTNEK
jgi:hypothetical protein